MSQAIDEVRIEPDEGGWCLSLTLDTGDVARFLIVNPEQFMEAALMSLGRWLEEGEQARATRPRPETLEEAEDLVREVLDPKSPLHRETMSRIYDEREKDPT